MRSALICSLVFLLAVSSIAFWTLAERVKKIESLQMQISKLDGAVSDLRAELRVASLAGGTTSDPVSLGGTPSGEQIELKTAADVTAATRNLAATASAQELATCLNQIDNWVLRPDEEKAATQLKIELAARLRRQVRTEVLATQQACLDAPSGNDAVKLHAAAGQILALYPMSGDEPVLAEVKRLAAQQVDLATRIELLRRQRYNQWAAKQIEAAVNGYNKGSSYWNPKKENKVLMDSLVQCLGEVDPNLLEPAVMELYSYVIDLTKGSISEVEKIQLAERLTDPSIHRKILGDF